MRSSIRSFNSSRLDCYSLLRNQKNGVLVREVILLIQLTLADNKMSARITLMEKFSGFIMLIQLQTLNTIGTSTKKEWNVLFIDASTNLDRKECVNKPKNKHLWNSRLIKMTTKCPKCFRKSKKKDALRWKHWPKQGRLRQPITPPSQILKRHVPRN